MLSKAQIAQVDTYVHARVAKELAHLNQNPDAVAREIADKAEEVVWRRFKAYTVLIGVLLAVIAWFGYSSFKDITDSARRQLDPIVNDALSKAKIAQTDVAATSGEVKATKEKLDVVSKEADTQKARLDSQTGEASRKLAELQASVDHANKMGAEYDAKVGALTQRMESQYARITTAVNSKTIAEVYPDIDTEPWASIEGKRLDPTQKKPGEVWVQVHLSGFAISRHILDATRLRELLANLEAAGYIPFLGTPAINGRMSGGLESLGTGDYYQSHVIYFDPTKQEMGAKLSQIVGAFVVLKPPTPELRTFSTSPDYNEFLAKTIVEKSGYDAQVFISCPSKP